MRLELLKIASSKVKQRSLFDNSTFSFSSLPAFRASCFSLMSCASALSAPSWCSSIFASTLSSSSLLSIRRFSNLDGSSSRF